MNKTEKKLVAAIESKDKAVATEAFKAFQALKSSTDEQCNEYFNQIEAIEDAPSEDAEEITETPAEEVVEVVIEETIEEVVEEVVEVEEVPAEPIVKEKRGRKAKKEITREQVIAKWNEFLGLLVDFKAQENRNRGRWSRWATTTLNQLRLVNKRRFR